MKKNIQISLLYFIVPFIVFILIGAFLILFIDKGQILMTINKFSNESLDRFFLFITDFGLGSWVALFGVLLAFYKFRWSFLTLISLGWVGIFSNLLKRIFFQSETRPFHYFLYDDFPRFIHDAPLIYFSSFPSGHTMTIFALCSMLSYLVKQKFAGFLFFLFALVVGISRIYLLQHFFLDVYFGAIFGIISTIIAVWIIDVKMKKYNPFFEKGFVKLLVKK